MAIDGEKQILSGDDNKKGNDKGNSSDEGEGLRQKQKAALSAAFIVSTY